MTMRSMAAGVLALAWAAGCSSGKGKPGSGTGTHDAGPGAPRVEIGIPDANLDFVPLQPGGDVPLETFGQGGTHATVAVRCIGLGQRAFVDVTVENLDSDSGAEVMTVPSTRPQLLLCRDMAMHVCDLLPIHVMTGGLADPDKKDGLPVRITAAVHNEAGQMASGSQDGVLRKRF
jgi:hypothetical protein